jgi:hypothetical protein
VLWNSETKTAISLTADIVPIVQQVGAPSIAQIEKLIGELHEAKSFLLARNRRPSSP